MISPLISIVIPLYNAERFLEKGLSGIFSQSYTNWEIVAVNDGSTDKTKEIFLEHTKDYAHKVKLIDQANVGGFAARNTGLDNVTGDYIALFDIDDFWYPNHLQDCLDVLVNYPDIDWVYASNKIIDLTQNSKVISEHNFYTKNKPKKFLKLKTEKRGESNLIIDKNALKYQLLYGLWLGQQFSLAKRKVFADYRFRANYRNEAADQISVIRALSCGYKLAYINKVHGEYAIHTSNVSAGCKDAPVEKYLRLRLALIRGFKEAEGELNLKPLEIRALNKRVANEYFWNIGYNIYLKSKNKKMAYKYFKKGIFYQPLNFYYIKTFIFNYFRRDL